MARSLETRLGIVLYGGVSLAIYENGVAQELFRAARGEPRKSTAYDLVKAIADTEIVLDIISGTSAGGVNGIMLGFALANNGDFRKSADLWREKADLMALLRKPGEQNVASLLDSRGFYQPALEDAFRAMQPNPPYGKPYASEIDLFVTGTDVHGSVFTEFDDQGHAIDVKDHRGIFRLSYRPERKNDFNDGPFPYNIPALAKLARITSCFPVAFEPVHVCDPDKQPPGADPAVIGPDRWLKRWGKLTHDAWFLDGGILNNKPFSYTIDAIFGRLAESRVDRLLFYVEPDPEQFADRPLGRVPHVAKAAGDALTGIPGYQSIAQDLQAIAERNNRLQQYRQILDSLGEAKPEDDWLEAPPKNPLAAMGPLDLPANRAYLASRLVQMRDRAILGILKQDGRRVLLDEAQKHAASILVQSFNEWPTDGTDTLLEFDVDFRMRRLYRCVEALREHPGAAPGVRRRFNHQIKMLEMVKYTMETALDDCAIPWNDLQAETARDWKLAQPKWQAVQNLMRRAMAPTPALGDAGTRDWSGIADADRLEEERRQRQAFMKALEPRIERLRGSDGSQAEEIQGNLLHDLEAQERSILLRLPPTDPIRLEYCRFLRVDCLLFPIESMAGIVSKDKIRTVRFSPIGDRFGLGAGKNNVSDKLCGHLLSNFGGFLKKSWRANDIMWGRLDAASQLLHCVVTPARIAALGNADYSGFDLTAMFPASDDADIRELGDDLPHLREYAQEHLAERPVAGRRSRFEQFLDRLITAAQTEIVEEEMPRVLGCAINQQVQWNRFPVRAQAPGVFRAPSQSWDVGVSQIDPAILEIARDRLLSLQGQPEKGCWVRFLRESYKVSAESLTTGIPRPVALELATHAALVFGNCLSGVTGAKKAERVRSSPIFRFVLDYPLRAIYKFVVFQRTAPEWARSSSLVLTVLSVAALAAGLVWHNPLIWGADGFHAIRFGIFLAGPALVLLLLFRLWALAVGLPVSALLLAATAGWLSDWRQGPGAISTAIGWLQDYGTVLWVATGVGLVSSILFTRAWRIALRALESRTPPTAPAASQEQAAQSKASGAAAGK